MSKFLSRANAASLRSFAWNLAIKSRAQCYSTTKESKNKYSGTLCLPNTSFPIRSGGSKRELELLSICTDSAYRSQADEKREKTFVLHDGPPYANGKLHIGHALNKILKDIINRYKMMRGFNINFVPGWDCHGLPIELKAIGDKSSTVKDAASADPMAIRQLAHKFALAAVSDQKAEFQRWGILGDWDNPYLTLTPQYEARQLEVFAEMVKKGCIYRGYKPVYWSPSSKTALAEAELEYPDEHISKSLYITFRVKQQRTNSGRESGVLDSFIHDIGAIIWTTTPWTIPANMAISYNASVEYSVVSVEAIDQSQPIQSNCRYLLLATNLIDAVATKLAAGNIRLTKVASFKGDCLAGYVCQHPLIDRDSPFVDAEHVTTDTGSGLVHTAPGHGMEDFLVGKRNQLQVLSPVDGNGCFTAECGISELIGLSVLGKGNDAVIDMLQANGALLKQERYAHKYPYDWRTKKPVILRATKQWFAQLHDLKGDALSALEAVKMVPEAGRIRLTNMVRDREEWCISRQRVWGVPIPVFYDAETDEPLITEASMRHIIELIRERGSDCWWTLSDNELLAPQYRNNGRRYIRGSDTLDVWFDSGSSWNGVLVDRGLGLPSDLYLEGSDQHRGWFQSSLLTSVAVTNAAPYRTVLTHGFVLDEHGKKMSKSLGNVVDPATVINNKSLAGGGADILRLWVSSSDYSRDVLIGPTILSKQADIFRKFRNTARFMLSVLGDFNPANDSVPFQNLQRIDKYILGRLYDVCNQITESYENYTFNKVYTILNLFMTVDLSAFYLDIVKDRLYADAKESHSRRAAQTAIYNILENVTKAAAPIICFTAEDIHLHLHSAIHKQDVNTATTKSIFNSGWFSLDDTWKQALVQPTADEHGEVFSQSQWDLILSLKSEINKSIEAARAQKLIGSSLEASVELLVMYSVSSNSAGAELESIIGQCGDSNDLEDIFMVSEVSTTVRTTHIQQQQQLEQQRKQLESESFVRADLPNGCEGDADGCSGVYVRVSKARKHKCPRCWRFDAAVEEHLCVRCDSVVGNQTTVNNGQ